MTDGGTGVRELARLYLPETRHQLCVSSYARAQSLLTNAEPYILCTPPSAERTTSVMEREMREVNRRTDVGARWKVSGITNLVRLRLAKRHNPDDYERVWSPLRKPASTTVFSC